MISDLTLSDNDEFVYLGSLLHDNFSSLYSLEDILNSNYQFVFGFYIDDKLIGFLLISKIYENVDILDIVVCEKYRRQGIASSLFLYCFDKFPDCDFMLEVNEKNLDAISLYNKLGFNIISKRKKYYHGVDALIMKRVGKNERC